VLVRKLTGGFYCFYLFPHSEITWEDVARFCIINVILSSPPCAAITDVNLFLIVFPSPFLSDSTPSPPGGSVGIPPGHPIGCCPILRFVSPPPELESCSVPFVFLLSFFCVLSNPPVGQRLDLCESMTPRFVLRFFSQETRSRTGFLGSGVV